MKLVIACVLAYLIGSLPPFRPPRATIYANDAAFRTMPIQNVLLMFGLDIGKGAFAVILAWIIAGIGAAHLAVIFVVLGEAYPCFPFRHARNGWAVATGALLVISPVIILISLAIYLLSLLLTRTFGLSFAIALIAFFIGLVLWAAQIYFWLLVMGLVGLLSLHRLKQLHKRFRLRRWKK